jgi:hypothetical protein
VAREAAADADRVGQFLDHLSEFPAYRWLRQRPLGLPESFLLNLGAALRLLSWERRGIQVHREAGFPEAREIVKDVVLGLLKTLTGARTKTGRQASVALEKTPRDLALPVMVLTVEQLAWNSRPTWDADIVLGRPRKTCWLRPWHAFCGTSATSLPELRNEP